VTFHFKIERHSSLYKYFDINCWRKSLDMRLFSFMFSFICFHELLSICLRYKVLVIWILKIDSDDENDINDGNRTPNTRPKTTEGQRLEIIHLNGKGYSNRILKQDTRTGYLNRKISREVKCHPSTVANILKKLFDDNTIQDKTRNERPKITSQWMQRRDSSLRENWYKNQTHFSGKYLFQMNLPSD